MSLLTFLFFTSVIYFAVANNIPHPVSTGDAGESVAPSDEPDYVDAIKQLIDAFSKAYDEHITPTLSQVEQEDQDYLKTIAINGCGSYMNYVMYLTLEEGSSQDADNDDVIVQMNSIPNYNPGYVPYTSPLQ